MPRKARPNPLTIRLPPEERAELMRRAEGEGVSVSGYFRMVAFDAPRSRVTRTPSPDRVQLARLLAAVGHIGGNINQLAYVANTGGWPESQILTKAQADILWMRHHLMLALGVTPPGPEP